MRLRLACLLALLLSLAASRPVVAAGDVLINPTADGATLRIPGASLATSEIVKNEPPRFIVSVHDIALKSRVLPNRSEWLRSVRVVGSEILGGSESRIIIETASTLLGVHLEAAGDGVAIVISGTFTTTTTTTTAPPEAEEAAAESAAASEQQPAPQAGESAAPATNWRAPKAPRETKPAPAAAPAPAPPRGQPWRNDVEGMVVIPGGEFVMGAVEGTSFADESPQHVLRLNAFRLDLREVTASEFALSPIPMPAQPEWSSDAANPVVNVTWHEAAEYCEWVDKRLPTEAEWERAARGTDSRAYPWAGAWSPTRANTGVDGDGFEHLAPTGSLPSGLGPEGAFDLSGNAWEWTADWYRKDTYSSYRTPNPDGPKQGSHKVARGGSFRSSSATTATSTVRLALPVGTRRDDVGFRCASSE